MNFVGKCGNDHLQQHTRAAVSSLSKFVLKTKAGTQGVRWCRGGERGGYARVGGGNEKQLLV